MKSRSVKMTCGAQNDAREFNATPAFYPHEPALFRVVPIVKKEKVTTQYILRTSPLEGRKLNEQHLQHLMHIYSNQTSRDFIPISIHFYIDTSIRNRSNEQPRIPSSSILKRRQKLGTGRFV